MARIILEVLGDKVFIPPEGTAAESEWRSPESLRGKVLIRAKASVISLHGCVPCLSEQA